MDSFNIIIMAPLQHQYLKNAAAMSDEKYSETF